jgi:anti-sigma B factor antagonist
MDRESLLSIAVATTADAAVLTIAGELDGFTVPVFHQHVRALTREGQHNLIVDLNGVTFIDAAGIGALVVARRRLRAYHGSVRLVVGEEKTLRLFRLVGLRSVFTIHSHLAEAIEATRSDWSSAAQTAGDQTAHHQQAI